MSYPPPVQCLNCHSIVNANHYCSSCGALLPTLQQPQTGMLSQPTRTPQQTTWQQPYPPGYQQPAKKSIPKGYLILGIGCLGLPILFLLIILFFSAVFSERKPTSEASPTKSSASEKAEQKNSGSEALGIVKRSYTSARSSDKQYKVAPLNGGTAILVDDLAAYWVKGGKLYAANGWAKTWSKNIEYAPTGIDFTSVKKAVDSPFNQTPNTESPAAPPAPQTATSKTRIEEVNGWKVTVLAYIPESKRKAVFYDLAVTQDRGVGDEASYTVVAKKHRLSKAEVRKIALEGAAKKWPMP